jgi:hypothetical protein
VPTKKQSSRPVLRALKIPCIPLKQLSLFFNIPFREFS